MRTKLAGSWPSLYLIRMKLFITTRFVYQLKLRLSQGERNYSIPQSGNVSHLNSFIHVANWQSDL